MTEPNAALRSAELNAFAPSTVSSARVLEIGEFALFYRGLPHQTESYYVGYRAYHGEGRPFFGLRALWQTLLRVRSRDHYDIVILHPPLLAWWRLRTIVYAFRFSVGEGRPLDLYGALTSTLYFQALRFLSFKIPLLAIDRDDHFTIPAHHMRLIDKVDAYYKRELPVDRWQTLLAAADGQLPGEQMRQTERWRKRINRLRPIGLGLRAAHVSQTKGLFGSPKLHDVFFAGMLEGSSFVRDRAWDLLQRLHQAGIDIDHPQERLPYDQFLKRCAGAWLTLSPEGFGWDCYRHVEAPLVGSVPIINAPTIERYRPLVPSEHCFIYFPDDIDGSVDLIRAALSNKAKLVEMAQRAYDHASQNLTEPAICRELLAEWANKRG